MNKCFYTVSEYHAEGLFISTGSHQSITMVLTTRSIYFALCVIAISIISCATGTSISNACALMGNKFFDDGRVLLSSCQRFWPAGQPAITFPEVSRSEIPCTALCHANLHHVTGNIPVPLCANRYNRYVCILIYYIVCIIYVVPVPVNTLDLIPEKYFNIHTGIRYPVTVFRPIIFRSRLSFSSSLSDI